MPNDAPAIIKEGSRVGTNVLRGRDVRFALQNVDVPHQLRDIVEKIAEINHANVQAIAELATMFNQMVDTMQGFSDVAHNMKETIKTFQRGMEGEEDEVIN